MDKDTLLHSMREAHATTDGLVRALSDDALAAPAPGIDGWTGHLPHLA